MMLSQGIPVLLGHSSAPYHRLGGVPRVRMIYFPDMSGIKARSPRSNQIIAQVGIRD
ncbi:hypothetical protein D3C78_1866360 [compost metagenome]